MNITYAPGEYSVFVETATRITNSLSTDDVVKGVLTTPRHEAANLTYYLHYRPQPKLYRHYGIITMIGVVAIGYVTIKRGGGGVYNGKDPIFEFESRELSLLFL